VLSHGSFDTVEDFLMKRLIALFLVTASVAGLSACNTMAGAGEDVSAGGHALTNSAEKAK
jgi:predicted small secreted protein